MMLPGVGRFSQDQFLPDFSQQPSAVSSEFRDKSIGVEQATHKNSADIGPGSSEQFGDTYRDQTVTTGGKQDDVERFSHVD
jgi:hypothetical protein